MATAASSQVPLEWYDEFDHVGYDLDGGKILRGTRKDELDSLIARFDDPNASRTVHDYLHGVDVVLSEADIALVKRLQKRRYPSATMNPFPDAVHHEYADKAHPLSNAPPRKAPFLPSRWEAKKVMRLVMAMRSEQYQKSVANRAKQDAKDKPNYNYLLWDDRHPNVVKHHKRLPPPKVPLPGNAESYNPPSEYLFTPEEQAEYDAMDPADRPYNFVPQKYHAMRHVPLYDPLIKERFERCLDLYLCPRENKTKLNIDPESLIPDLPKPRELKPYPERLSVRFEGHTGRVYSVSVSPSGEWLLSASADGTVRLWEVATSRCERTWQLGGEVRCVAWNPSAELDMAAAVVGSRMLLLLPKTTPGPPAERARALLEAAAPAAGGVADAAWSATEHALAASGAPWQVAHAKSATHVAWHHKGDYIATVSPEAASRAVLLHQVSKRSTGSPFSKSKGRVESVAFHPSKPMFFVATQRHVRVYHLLKQELAKKLTPSVQWISCMAVHPGGDNLIIGSYDRKVAWFDMDLSATPYKTLRPHELAVRAAAYHPRLPLFATASDDATVNMFHGRVYADLNTNPLLVPVKKLKGHTQTNHLGVLGLAFHPSQPWLFSAGADGLVHLYTEL